MSVTVSAQSEVNFSFLSESDANGITGNPAKREFSTRGDSKRSWSNGTGTGQATRPYAKRFALTAASGVMDLNLSALICPDFGDTINFDKIKIIYIKNQEPVDSDGAFLLISPAPSNGWVALFNGATISAGDPTKLGPQDVFFLTRIEIGIDCPTLSSVLRFTHDGGSSGALNFDLGLLGTV